MKSLKQLSTIFEKKDRAGDAAFIANLIRSVMENADSRLCRAIGGLDVCFGDGRTRTVEFTVSNQQQWANLSRSKSFIGRPLDRNALKEKFLAALGKAVQEDSEYYDKDDFAGVFKIIDEAATEYDNLGEPSKVEKTKAA